MKNIYPKARKIIYFDMDNVLVDFKSGIEQLSKEDQELYKDRYDEHPRIFALMFPLKGAQRAFKVLSTRFDCYILSTAPWGNPNAWKHKREWVEHYLGEDVYKRLILSHNKHLNVGEYLIDDRTANGAGLFTGEHIHFGTEKFPDWESVLDYFKDVK